MDSGEVAPLLATRTKPILPRGLTKAKHRSTSHWRVLKCFIDREWSLGMPRGIIRPMVRNDDLKTRRRALHCSRALPTGKPIKKDE